MLSVRPESAIEYRTLSDGDSFSALGGDWDDLVRAMPRPSPYLLHGWLAQWWRYFGHGRRLCIETAWAGDRLVGALPLCIDERGLVRTLEFVGGRGSALADVLLADGRDGTVATALAARAASSGQHVADLFGLPGESRLLAALGERDLRVVPRVEAPVLDLRDGWDAVYAAKTSKSRRALHRRRRRQLSALGELASTVARSEEELAPALEHAFDLYARRWHGRPDASDFLTRRGRPFERAALRALATEGIPRIVLLLLDGRPLAFSYSFVLEHRLYIHKLAFDPTFARYSPGVVNLLDTLELASAEGVGKVEFLGGAERYKVELADGFEPLYEAVGLASDAVGALAREGMFASMRLRLRLKRSPTANWLYYRAAAPAQRAWAHLCR